MSNLLSLGFYFICFYTSIIFFKYYMKSKRLIFLILAMGIPILIATFRLNVGTDFQNYIALYYKPILEGRFVMNSYEYIFFYIVKISTFFQTTRMMFFMVSFLTVYLLFLYLKNNRKYDIIVLYSIYIFIFFPQSFNIMRQSLAMVLILLATSYLLKRRQIEYFCLQTIAIFIHNSAIIGIFIFIMYILYFNYNIKFYKLLLVIFFLGFVVLSLVITNFNGIKIPIFYKYNSYFLVRVGQNKEFYLKIILFLFFYFFRRYKGLYSKKFDFFLILLFIDLLITYLGFYNLYIKRLGLYFSIFQISCFGEVLKRTRKRYITLLKFMAYIYISFYFICIYYVLGNGEIFPYNF